LSDFPGRHQQLVDADHHDRRAQHHPRPVAADRRLGAVHHQGDQRIEQHVDEPHHGDRPGHRQEAQAQADVMPRQVDAVDQQHHRHRHAQRAEGEEGVQWGALRRGGRGA